MVRRKTLNKQSFVIFGTIYILISTRQVTTMLNSIVFINNFQKLDYMTRQIN